MKIIPSRLTDSERVFEQEPQQLISRAFYRRHSPGPLEGPMCSCSPSVHIRIHSQKEVPVRPVSRALQPHTGSRLAMKCEFETPDAAEKSFHPPQAAWHTHRRKLGTCLAEEKAFNQLLSTPGCPATARAVVRKNSFGDRKGIILRGSPRMRAESVMTKTVFISNHVIIEENHQQMENVFSILIVMDTNQNQLPI